MLLPAFQFSLNQTILSGIAAVGQFDGKHPSLACATSGGKVFIHSPHTREVTGASLPIKFLNINRTITCLATGPVREHSAKDALLVGTPTNVLAYDVQDNSDLFFKEVPDGVQRVVFGEVQGIASPITIVGGTCSILGFDSTGEEVFWTVTGDVVSAMAFQDVSGDGRAELLVGSEDYEIRAFQGDDVFWEITETDKISGLCPIAGTRFGYALANGTIGVYDGSTRVWRVKSKHKAQVISAFDLDADGVPELISGWNTGKFEARKEANGKLVYKDNVHSSVSAILQSDYRLDGREEVVVCSAEGEVRGYLPVEPETAEQLIEEKEDDRELRELQQRKQQIEAALRGMDSNMKQMKTGDISVGAIPSSTQVQVATELNETQHCIDLVLSTNNESVVRTVVVFSLEDSGLFGEGCESLVVYPPDPIGSIRVSLAPKQDKVLDLKIQAIVGARGSVDQFHVYELTHTLPKFAMFARVRGTDSSMRGAPPRGKCTFVVGERAQRVMMWIQRNFFTQDKHTFDSPTIDMSFVSLRDSKQIRFVMVPAAGGTVTIHSDDIELVAEVVQHLCNDLGITELESTADFPDQMESFREVLMKVDEYNAIRLKFTAEMADNSQQVKTLVIKAEDARILGDMSDTRRQYAELYNMNTALIGEYSKRATNHQRLLDALKDVNQMIQKAAKLRMGEAKTRVVAECRSAIKSNNIQALFQIIASGKSPAGR